MLSVILLLAAYGAEPAAAVTPLRAMVLYGTDDKSQKGELEEWIVAEVNKAGSPIANSYTKWIDLTGEEQELYSSLMGGRTIRGKVTSADGKHVVEIRSRATGEKERTITLKDGERIVLKLTPYPGAGNVFLALIAPRSK